MTSPLQGELPGRVVIVDPDRERRESVQQCLTTSGYQSVLLDGGDELLQVCAEFDPDLLLIAIRQQEGSGLELCGDVRASDPSRHTPVILIADGEDERVLAAGLFAGADDVVVDVRRNHELRARIHVQLRNKRLFDALRRVRSERDLLRRDAQTDPLTSLLNRRSLESAVSERCAAGERFGVLFMDIDHFKLINDRFGHDMGDRVLVAVAHVLKAGLRPGDIIARYGGEEFVALIAGAGPESARLVAERLRRHVEQMPPVALGPESVTISVGTTVYDPQKQEEAHLDLMRRADVALYAAKRAGRNRVVLAPPGRATPDLEDVPAANVARSRTPAEGTKITPTSASSG